MWQIILLMWYFFACVLVTYDIHFKCYPSWRFAASSRDPEATGAALAAKTQEMQAAYRRVLWAHGSLTLLFFVLKFSPKSGKCSKSNIFNSEPLLLEDEWFHESGPLSINKNESIMISTVGSLLKELVFLSLTVSAYGHTHTLTFRLHQSVISTHYCHGIALDLRSRSLTESLITSLQTWSKIIKSYLFKDVRFVPFWLLTCL